ncbi:MULTISPECIES: hypothetical protein [unclassified Streptomyces]|nr:MULTISPECIES: hypothetical protein [unclassified Streptomyces]
MAVGRCWVLSRSRTPNSSASYCVSTDRLHILDGWAFGLPPRR